MTSNPHDWGCSCKKCAVLPFQQVAEAAQIIADPKACRACLGWNEPHTTCHPREDEDRTQPTYIEGYYVTAEPELDESNNRVFWLGIKGGWTFHLAVAPTQTL